MAGLRTLDVAVAEELWPPLDDPAPGVVRQAAAALLPSAGLVPGAWLAERLAPDRPRHVRITAYRLSVARGEPVPPPTGPGVRS
ncbi:hypothetical protein [Streptomyces sp. bgisy032]|uniref:hypothetical protein n=1 Tax=Streptomyces sp. bgisy032 TaxID=3413773 RepID=UPI003D76196A